MPRGIPGQPYLHCRKCEGLKFATISELRKHQWAEHSETFANLRKAAREVNKLPKKKGQFHCTICGKRFDSQANVQRHNWKAHREQRVSVRKAKDLPAVARAHRNGDMKVADLLGELHHQQKFIDDVIALISGIVARHQETRS